MQNIAQVYLDGNLTADPETKTVGNNRTVTGFYVAANHEWGRKEGNNSVSYFSVECWEKLAENCGRYLHKGSRVTLMGELRQDRWKDAEGRSRSQVKIIARFVRFDSRRPVSEENGDAAEQAGDAASVAALQAGSADQPGPEQREPAAA